MKMRFLAWLDGVWPEGIYVEDEYVRNNQNTPNNLL